MKARKNNRMTQVGRFGKNKEDALRRLQSYLTELQRRVVLNPGLKLVIDKEFRYEVNNYNLNNSGFKPYTDALVSTNIICEDKNRYTAEDIDYIYCVNKYPEKSHLINI